MAMTVASDGVLPVRRPRPQRLSAPGCPAAGLAGSQAGGPAGSHVSKQDALLSHSLIGAIDLIALS
jgi:hypothetical protein